MKILLDTHTLLWMALDPKKLSKSVQARIDSEHTTEILVSSFTVWEICKWVQKRKVSLNAPVDQWLETVLHQPRVFVADMTTQIAIDSCNLPGKFHADPADQIIVATARVHGAMILTKDQKILDYPHVKSEW